jgi:hypothetical protein
MQEQLHSQQSEMEALRNSNLNYLCQLQEHEAKKNEELSLILHAVNHPFIPALVPLSTSTNHPTESHVQHWPLPSEGSFVSCEVIQPPLPQPVREVLEATPGEVDTDLKLN